MTLDRFAEIVVEEHRRTVIAVVLVAVLVLGLGVPSVVLDTTLEEFRGGTAEHSADSYIQQNLSGQAPNSTGAIVIVRGEGNVLTKESYLAQLRAQQRLREDDVVGPTLVEDQQPLGLANVVAIVAMERQNGTATGDITVEPRPPLEEQIAAMEDIQEFRLGLYTSYAVGIVMDDVEHTWPEGGPFATVPTSYEGNGRYAESTAIVVSQKEDTPPDRLADSQTRMAEIVDEEVEGDASALGNGVVDDELRRSSFDSLGIVGPLAALFVVLVSMFAYRDRYDVALGLFGVLLVLVWTFGFIGWMGITFNQLFVAVPVLLMGLAIDFAIHVVMRYREERPPEGETVLGASGEPTTDGGRAPDSGPDADGRRAPQGSRGRDGDGGGAGGRGRDGGGGGRPPGDAGRPGAEPTGVRQGADPGPGGPSGGGRGGDRRGGGGGRPPSIRTAMAAAMAGLGSALALVTVTTATGFMSNWISEVAPIRQFGLVSAFGIVGAFVVFALLLPALKVELDERLEARGEDRRAPAFGTEGGRLSVVLAVPVAAAKLSPKTVVVATLLVTAVATGGAATVDTTFEQEDLLVEEVPAWMESLGPLAPGEYSAQQTIEYANDATFVYDGTSTQILVRGDITRDDTLERVQNASDAANETDVVLVFPDNEPGTQSPVRVMGDLAEDDEEFAEVFRASDSDGDGVPDQDLEALYDAFYEAAPEGAANWIQRTDDGEYVALRIAVPVDGTAGEATIDEQIQPTTEPVDGDGLDAIATGQPIMNQAVAENLFTTVIDSFVITIAVVLAVLMAVYRRLEGYASLGFVTILPVAFAVAWITGSMAALGIPFNVMTALITSFTIGLGIDYSIHLSERYVYELDRGVGAEQALENAVFGTGGALLGSTASTAGGIAILGLALLVPLQQFGIITALTIVYAFLGSVVVLPSLLVLWTDWADADPAAGEPGTGEPAAPRGSRPG